MRTLLTALCMAAAQMIMAAGAGTWRNYLSYSDITDVEQAGGTLFVLASGALYSYNTADQSITTYDKANALSDCGIELMEWCADAARLVVVYESGSIDLVSRTGDVTNMSDYRNYSTTADKTIHGLDVIGGRAYLSTGFGVVNINVAAAEVTETYNLGFRVDYVYTEGGRIYAASPERGIYSALATDNLLDPDSWSFAAQYMPRDKATDHELLALAETLNPGGPRHNWFTHMQYLNNRLYTCGGYFISGYVQENRPGTVQILENGEWTVYPGNVSETTGYPYRDINCLAVDPADPDHLFVGGCSGLYEFSGGSLTRYFNKDNSLLMSAVDRGTVLGNDYVLVNGLMFDDDRNLWMLNSQTQGTSILSLPPDGDLVSYHSDRLMSGDLSFRTMQNLITDSRGLMWFINVNGFYPAIVCYQPETEGLNIYAGTFYNQSGTPQNITFIFCMAEDLDGNIWVGTDIGPYYLARADMDNTAQPTLTQFIVPRNDGTNYGDYLLSGVSISCMAVDGAGRKWFGTNGNGVYLISADNLTQIEHFTAEETPLLSDEIKAITIDGASGEVYIATEKGLCSYTSDVTAPSQEMTKDNVYAYPNPVRPGYTGPITVTGLTLNAEVKITTANGSLVAEGRSTGGTFIWDGCDRDGRRVASGIYMVNTSTATGDSGTVCKIAVVN